MAFQVQKINPLDLQPRKAIGVKIPFTAKDVFTPTYTSQDALKTNLINFILTGQGERYLNPDFGINLRALLFEQMVGDNLDEVEYKVRQGISTWFPTVIINKIQLATDIDKGEVILYMSYGIEFTNIADELVINFIQ